MGAGSLLTLLLRVLTIHQYNISPCDEAVIAIVHRHTERTVHLFSLKPNLLSSNLITSFKTPLTLNTTSAHQQWRNDTCVVLSYDLLPVIRFVQNTPVRFRRDTPWIVGLYGSMKSEELENLFAELFNRGILNVVVVNLENTSASVRTYFPFRTESNAADCYNYKPVVIDIWRSDRFVHRNEMFPKNKVDNVQNCFVKSLVFTFFPFIKYSETDKKQPLQGIAADLFYALKLKMNFTPIYSLAKNYTSGVEELATSPAALGFGVAGYEHAVAHATVFGSDCFSWCLPTFVRRIRGWEAIGKTFFSSVWLAFIGSLIAACIATRLLSHSRHDVRIRSYPSWLGICNIVCEVSVCAPKETKLRFVFASTSILCLVIATAFKARLHTLMTSVPPVSKMSVLSQVYESKLDLFVVNELKWMMATIQNETYYKLRVRLGDRKDEAMMRSMLKGLNEGTGAFLTAEKGCRMFAGKLGKTDEGYYKTYIIPDCIVNVASLGFGHSYTSPFDERVTRITRAMWESGMAGKYFSQYLSPEIISSREKVLSLQDMRDIFLILIIGLVVSCFVIVAEIWFKRDCDSSTMK